MENTKSFGILSCEFPAIYGTQAREAESSEKGDVAKVVMDWLQRNNPDLQIAKKKSTVYCNSETKPECRIFGFDCRDKNLATSNFNNIGRMTCKMYLYAVATVPDKCNGQQGCSSCREYTFQMDGICYQVYKLEKDQLTQDVKDNNFGLNVLKKVAGQCLKSSELLDISHEWATHVY